MSKGKSVYKWTAIDRICNSVMTFGGNLFLARMLDPSDFGLLAMVAIFSALASNISGCGMSDGLINKKDPTREDYSTVFTFNVIMGLFFAVLFVSCSGYIASYFGHSELKSIMIAIGICFVFQTLCMVQETKMRKDLNFKKMAIVRLSATASSLFLAIILVLKGFGYWGLVSMQIFLSFFLFLYYLLCSRWMPRIGISRSSFKEMFGYGVHLMAAYVCYQIARNINTSVLGKFSSASVSGAYGQGQKVEEVPFSLSESILNWPFFSVLSSIKEAREKRDAVSRMHSMIIFVNTTIACLLFSISDYAFNALYGEKWNEAIPIFNVLLVFGLATSVKMFYQTIFKSHSKTTLIRNLTIFEVVLQVILLALFYKSGGVIIAMTQTIPVVTILVAYGIFYLRLEKINLTVYLHECTLSFVMPILVMIFTILVTKSWINDLNSWISTMISCIVYVLIMIAFCEAVKPPFYLDLRKRVVKFSNQNV